MLLSFSHCHIWLFTTQWAAAHQASLSITISWSLLKFMSIELVMLSNHLLLCCPLLFLPSIFPNIRVFSSELALRIRWPKYQSFSINPSNEYSGLILSDWPILSPCSPRDSQESSPTPQFRSINLLVLSFLYVQLSHPYMPTEKPIALTILTFVGKTMSLLCNVLLRFVIAFLPRSKGLLILWL